HRRFGARGSASRIGAGRVHVADAKAPHATEPSQLAFGLVDPAIKCWAVSFEGQAFGRGSPFAFEPSRSRRRECDYSAELPPASLWHARFNDFRETIHPFKETTL